MKIKVLLVTVLFIIGLSVPFSSVLVGKNIEETVELKEPSGLIVEENSTDVVLDWGDIEDHDSYKVYWSKNVTDEFPDGWNCENSSISNWTHEGALNQDEDYFYLVRGVKDGILGNITSMGYKVDIEMKHYSDLKETWNWISLPYDERDYDEDGSYSAIDIVKEIEDEVGFGYINKIAKWDPTNSTKYPMMSYNISSGNWDVADDFTIYPGEAVALNVTNNFTWTLTGVEDEHEINESYFSSGTKQFISLPYTFLDVNMDNNISASDIVSDIEGGLGTGRNETIHSVNLWNDSMQNKSDNYYYSSTEGWTGSDFKIEHGSGIYIKLTDNITWTPPLTSSYISSLLDEDRYLRVDISEPTRGTSWTGGSSHNITLEFDTNMHVSDLSARLQYVYNGTGPYLIGDIGQGEINNYTWNYTWTVPDINSDDVSIIVNAQGLGHKAWNIVGIEVDSKAPEIVNNTPKQGETITTDSYLEVEFDEPVDIEDFENNFTLYQGDTPIPGSVTGIDGMRTIRFTADEPMRRQLSYNYRLMGGIRDLSDPGNILNVDLNIEFTTVEGPLDVTVEGPEINEEYRIGNTTYINWTVGEGNIAEDPIDISYSLDGGESWITIKNDTANTGSYLWTIPKNAMVDYPVSNVKVNVSCTNKDGFTGYGYSVPFTIFENRLPKVEVLRPYEGMQVVRGQTYTISWEADDEVPLPQRPIVISISTDGGASWKVIDQNVRNEGSYLWKVDAKPGNATINVTCIDSNQHQGWGHSEVFKVLRENPLNLSLNPDNESFYSRDSINLTWDSPPLIEGEQRILINFTGDDGESWSTLEEINEDRNYSVIRLPFETSSDCKFKLTIYDSEDVLYKIDSKKFSVFPEIVEHEVVYLGEYFMISIEFDGWVSQNRMERSLTIYKDGEPMEISRDNMYQKTTRSLIYLSPRLPEGKYRVEFNSTGVAEREFEDVTVFTFEEEGTESKIVTYWPMLFLIPLALIMFYLYRGKGEKSTRKINSNMVEIER